MKLNSCSYPKGNFGGNQLLDGSMSLSPLYPRLTIDLHVRTVCELPPGFPLPSFYASIDHHLSGPDIHATTRIAIPTTAIGRWCLPSFDGIPTCFTFIARPGFTSPKHSHTCQTPWSVFQDGRLTNISSASRTLQIPQVGQPAMLLGLSSRTAATALPKRATIDPLCTKQKPTQRSPTRWHITPPKERHKPTHGKHSLPTLPFQRFQVLFNSLFKVLFIFPSRYLFAIGLSPLFSL